MQPSSNDKAFQMLWDCRFCGTKKLLGVDHRHCPNCGAAQDPEWRYFPSEADKKEISDPKYAYAGVDKICPFCQQPNSAAANFCKACGGDLSAAKTAVVKEKLVLGTGQDAAGIVDDVALKRFQSEQGAIKAKSKQKSRLPLILGIVAFICIAILGTLIFLSNSTYDTKVKVTDVNWQRTISVQHLSAVSSSDWQDQVPSGAYNRSCSSKDRPHQESYQEACGVEKVDRGDGSFTEKQKMCTKSRTVYTSDTYCNYTINQWQNDRELKTSGGTSDALVWPNFTPSTDLNSVGAEKEGSRTQTLNVLFQTIDQKQNYTYNPDSEDEWRKFQVGQQYSLDVNRLEIPQWKTLKLLSPR